VWAWHAASQGSTRDGHPSSVMLVTARHAGGHTGTAVPRPRAMGRASCDGIVLSEVSPPLPRDTRLCG